jgi:regulator of protease activity HflC (stomatin/prohibitin superfamily)
VGQLLQLILDNLYKLWPIRIIDADEQGLRFHKGVPTLRQPGICWFIPGLQKVEKINVVYQEIDCEVQSMETTDGISISFSANAGFVVTNVVKYRLGVHDADATIERCLRGILGEIVETTQFADLRASRKRLADRAKRELIKQVEPWGVEVQKVRLTDFTRSKQYRLFGMSTFN